MLEGLTSPGRHLQMFRAPPSSFPDGFSKSRRRRTARGLCVLVILLVSAAFESSSALARSSTCPKGFGPAPSSAAPSTGEEKFVPLDEHGNELGPDAAVIRMTFGSGRDARKRKQTYRVPKGVSPSAITVAPVND